MSVDEKAKNNTTFIKEQIDRFDNKANILIAVVSIVFAISMSVVDAFPRLATLQQTEKIDIKYILMTVFLCLYIISFVLEMFFLVSVIYPRKKRTNNKSTIYYYDVSKMDDNELIAKLECDDTIAEIEQLKNNAQICYKKHRYIVHAIWTLIPLFTFAIALFVTVII